MRIVESKSELIFMSAAGIFLSSIGGILLVSFPSYYRSEVAFDANAISASGTVVKTSKTTEHFVAGGRVTYWDKYTSIVEFRTHNGELIKFTTYSACSSEQDCENKTVHVKYDPSRPNQARIDSELIVRMGAYGVKSLFFFLPGIYVLWCGIWGLWHGYCNRDLGLAISFDPEEDANVYYNRGVLKQSKLDDSQGALADFNKALSLNPEDANVYYGGGNLKKDQMNNPQGALADSSKAIAHNTKDAYAYYSRGNLKATKLNDPQGALADYDQAIALNPKYALAYASRGNLKATKLNDPQEALADYDQAIALNPKDAEAYYNRGILKQNDARGAIKDFRTAARIFRAQGQTQYLQMAIGLLNALGATEKP
jgi:TPR repeat/Protein of unknown function (DUF3592)/Tetratricopeptide repeat